MNPLLLLLSLAATQPDPALLAGLEYRQLPLTRGGRSTAVTGVAADPFTFYFDGIGGDVWKSTNAGTTWHNVSDRYFETGSVGAIAVSDSNPLVVYAGTGTACPRSNVSPGVGVYRSDDGGATWVHAGLRDAGQIGRIRILNLCGNNVIEAPEVCDGTALGGQTCVSQGFDGDKMSQSTSSRPRMARAR